MIFLLCDVILKNEASSTGMISKLKLKTNPDAVGHSYDFTFQHYVNLKSFQHPDAESNFGTLAAFSIC